MGITGIVCVLCLFFVAVAVKDLFFADFSYLKYFVQQLYSLKNTYNALGEIETVKNTSSIVEAEKDATYVFDEEWKKCEFSDEESEKIKNVIVAISFNVETNSSDIVDSISSRIEDILKENLFYAKNNNEKAEEYRNYAIRDISGIIEDENIKFKHGFYAIKSTAESTDVFAFIDEKITEVFQNMIKIETTEIKSSEVVAPETVCSNDLEKSFIVNTNNIDEQTKKEIEEQKVEIINNVKEELVPTDLGKVDTPFNENISLVNKKKVAKKILQNKKTAKKAKNVEETIKKSTKKIVPATKKVAKKTSKKVTKKTSKR